MFKNDLLNLSLGEATNNMLNKAKEIETPHEEKIAYYQFASFLQNLQCQSTLSRPKVAGEPYRVKQLLSEKSLTSEEKENLNSFLKNYQEYGT